MAPRSYCVAVLLACVAVPQAASLRVERRGAMGLFDECERRTRALAQSINRGNRIAGQRLHAAGGELQAGLGRLARLMGSPFAQRQRAVDMSNANDPRRFVIEMTSSDSSWDLKVDTGSVRVWRRKVPGSAFAEIRGNGILHAPPHAVLQLITSVDEATIRSYNPLYESGRDVAQLDGSTKLSYGRVRAVFPFKPRDTLTRVSRRKLGPELDGGTVLILHAAEHADAPVLDECVRAKIIRGMHLVQPVAGKPQQTNFTFTQQVDAGGIVPASLMNLLITRDSVQFVQRLGAAAKASKGRR